MQPQSVLRGSGGGRYASLGVRSSNFMPSYEDETFCCTNSVNSSMTAADIKRDGVSWGDGLVKFAMEPPKKKGSLDHLLIDMDVPSLESLLIDVDVPNLKSLIV